MSEPIQAYPLQWPAGKRRTTSPTCSSFSVRRHGGMSGDRVRRELRLEVSRLGASDLIVSSNMALRADGMPYAGRRAPVDQGVAVYFKYRKKQMCFACDSWSSIDENLWAIVKTIEALRGIERWGSGDMMAQAFTGFTALPAPEQWFQVLGVGAHASREEIERAYREKAMRAHPDRGGSDAEMARLNVARDQGLSM